MVAVVNSVVEGTTVALAVGAGRVDSRVGPDRRSGARASLAFHSLVQQRTFSAREAEEPMFPADGC
jgi:hypothetical protein